MSERAKMVGSLAVAAFGIAAVTLLGALGRLEGQAAVAAILAILGILSALHVPPPGQSTHPPAGLWLILSLGGLLSAPGCYVDVPIHVVGPRCAAPPARALYTPAAPPVAATQINFGTQALPFTCPHGTGCLGVDAATGGLYYVDTDGVGTPIGGAVTLEALTPGTGISGSAYDGSVARTWAIAYGSTGTTACVGNDSRLSNARTPTAHAPTHVTGGGDTIADAVAAGASGLLSGTDKTKLDATTPANIPSAGQKAALAGTSGTPGAGNPYVTDADARNTNTRTPTAHAATHVTGGGDTIANAIAAGNAGLMSGADKTKLDALPSSMAAPGAIGLVTPNSGKFTGLTAPSLDRADAGALILGATNATSIELMQSITLPTGKILVLGGNTLMSADKLQGQHLAFNTQGSGSIIYFDGTSWVQKSACADNQSIKWVSSVPTCYAPVKQTLMWKTGGGCNTGTKWYPVTGGCTSSAEDDLTGVQIVNTAGTLKNLVCLAGQTAIPVGGAALTIGRSTVTPGSFADTTITCTGAQAAYGCVDGGNTVAVNQFDQLVLKQVTTNGWFGQITCTAAVVE